ncbi:MAG: hypothetical protein GXO26_06240 [Crenarchaeota archaeon]|nr:hypothetical protein [Thermoproteota archaeon]
MGEKIILSHFDSHGVATGVSLAKSYGEDKVRVIAKYPDTGPRMFAKFVNDNLDMFKGKDVIIVDIPVDISNPDEFLSALEKLSSVANKVYYLDHHETDIRYADKISKYAEMKLFRDAASMAEYVMRNCPYPVWRKLALVGVVADRDPSILRIVKDKSTLNRLYVLANKLDVLVRRNIQDTIDNLMEKGANYLEEVDVEYPAERIALTKLRDKVISLTSNAILFDVLDTYSDRELGIWLPKAVEYLLYKTSRDYAVVPAIRYDPRTRGKTYTISVIQYWLSNKPEAEQLVKQIASGRKYFGHGKYVNIIVEPMNHEDMLAVARRIFNSVAEQGRSKAPAPALN